MENIKEAAQALADGKISLEQFNRLTNQKKITSKSNKKLKINYPASKSEQIKARQRAFLCLIFFFRSHLKHGEKGKFDEDLAQLSGLKDGAKEVKKARDKINNLLKTHTPFQSLFEEKDKVLMIVAFIRHKDIRKPSGKIMHRAYKNQQVYSLRTADDNDNDFTFAKIASPSDKKENKNILLKQGVI
mgnify:CR=1 FL=1